MKEANLSEMSQKIQKNIKEITKIKKKLNRFTSAKLKSDVSQFDIKSEESWDFIKRNLYKTGIFLEQEIQDYLKELGIKFESNYQFFYPNDPGKYYIDIILEEISRQRGRTERIQKGNFEIDIIASEFKEFSDQNFEINVKINYIFECKSRNNPPVNYLVIPRERGLTWNYNILGSTFLPVLEISDNEIISSNKNPIGVEYGSLSIDRKVTFKTAFWELFRTIDELCHQNIGYGEYIDFNLLKDLSEDFFDEFNGYRYPDLEKINDLLLKNKKYPHNDSEKIRFSIQLYVPIIIVNGNIYKLDLKNISEGSLKQHVEKIQSFIQWFDVPKISNTKRKYYCYEQLLFRFLDFFSREFGSRINPEIMPILCISSQDFKKTFSKFKEKVEYQLELIMREKMKNLYLDNTENIKKFKTFCLFFIKWKESFNNEIYKYLKGL